MRAQLVKYRDMNLGDRSKRSPLPFIGGAFSCLFGTVDADDPNIINTNDDRLAANQQNIIHVLEESISVLNARRVKISENRDKLLVLSR